MNSDNTQKKIMTHIVLGYPSLKANLELIKVMSDAGVDYIEMQIPFTDPIADGPTILNANQKALAGKMRVSDCLKFAGEAAVSFKDIGFLFMSYYNIIYNTGIEKFVRSSKEKGLYGLIVPDIPYEEDREGFFPVCRRYGINPVYVFSPGTSEARLKKIRDYVSGFAYCTARVGITGAGKDPHRELLDYVRRAKKILDIPVAVGFGIDSALKAQKIAEAADIIIIGSRILNIVNEAGKDFHKPVFEFLRDVRKKIK